MYDQAMATEEKNRRLGKRLKNWGIVLTILSVVALPAGWYLFTVLFLTLGPVFWVFGWSVKMVSERHIACLKGLAGRQKMSLDELAGITRLSYANVKMSLENMIKTGLLSGARIDERRREIIFWEETISECERETPLQSMVVVQCPNCQAPNAIRRGCISVCEYCGQKISG